eukprot:CAMPEP_0185213052 /NCGR_PEP_ID=MMETSP1140-20130426/67841_1 /TAXON_ID=298111 /ORGANISM="Pavlova sp., Strain CCMP459" /LENGTH=88 /DNA_ID=CAMNT_0027780911 /DNA_START=644 /DNA_END=908 /DNA_ORIENTATION=+
MHLKKSLPHGSSRPSAHLATDFGFAAEPAQHRCSMQVKPFDPPSPGGSGNRKLVASPMCPPHMLWAGCPGAAQRAAGGGGVRGSVAQS